VDNFDEQVAAVDEALTELMVVPEEDRAWSLIDYLGQRGWDLVRTAEPTR
jgi:hypothetical protein